MNKFIVFLLCALFFGSCNEEEDGALAKTCV